MKLYASGGELATLEAALGASPGSARASAAVALAWQLRQRDSARAMALLDTAGPLLASPGLAPQAARALRARSSLIACEVSALFCKFDAAEAQLATARANLMPAVDPTAEGDSWLAEAIVAKARGERERELAAYDQGVACFKSGADPTRLALAQIWAGYERAFTQPDAELAPGAVAPAATDADAHAAWNALWCAARALTLSRREPAQAADIFLHASDQAQSVGMVRHAVVCTMNAGTALQGLGDFDLAADCFDVAATLARRTGWPALIGSSQTRLGGFLKELGRLEESRAKLSEALVSLSVTPAGINTANACSALAQTLLALGRGAESIEPMAAAIRMYRDARSTDNLALNLIGQARALAAAGQPQQALAAIDEAERLIEKHGFTALGVGVNEALAEIHQQHALAPPAGMTVPTAALHYAEATLREGLLINGWRPPASLYVQLADGWAAAGDLAQAYAYARKALAVKEQDAAHKLNHPLAVLRLRREPDVPQGGTPGATRPANAPEDDDTGASALSSKILTRKEREILQLLARSYSNKEIATALDVSDETVKWHLKNMFNKLEAGSRKHAVTRARTLGVISFST